MSSILANGRSRSGVGPPSRHTRTRWGLLGAFALAALASCGDEPTLPRSPSERPAAQARLTYDPWRARAGAEEVTVTRRTEAFETRGGKRVSTGRRVKVTTLGRDVVGAKRGDRVPTAAGQPDAAAVHDLPPVGLTFGSRRSALGKNVAWKNRHALAGVPGVEVEVQGVGDAPASVLRYYRGGTLERTVTQSYRHRGNRWELLQRETTTPDGRLRDLLTVEWGGGAPESDFPFLRAPSPGETEDWLADPFTALEEDCDPCKALREAKDAAFESFLWKDAAFALICFFTPPPGNVVACLTASIAVAEAFSAFVKADSAYDQCMASPPPCPKPNPPPGGGGDEGDGGTCYYEVWYDAATGEEIYRQLLYCVSS
jgi:hypothetical protein